MKNKVMSSLMAMAMLVLLAVPVQAINVSGGTGESSAILNQEQTNFNVTVPTSLPVAVDGDGVVTTASDVEIHNNSYGPVVISDIRVDVINGWSLVAFNKDMRKSAVGLKEFGFSIQDDEVQTDGGISLTPASWESIPGNGSIYLNYDAKISPQKTALKDVNIANVVFTLEWNEETSKYVLATDADFSYDDFRGYFRYTGSDEYVEIPHTIKGIPVTSYKGMFEDTSVKGVKSTNTNVTNMEGMFTYSQATNLDLSELDTSNVVNMKSMFNGSKATNINLSRFDTSNVTNMQSMFALSKVTTLDLSSFATSNVIDMWAMFSESEATVGFARTKADADKLNSSPNKPAGLTFVPKVPDTGNTYVLATDDDFDGTTDGNFNYKGTDEYVEIPHIIKGVNVTSYNMMFYDYMGNNTNVKGVKSTNPNITNMIEMFAEHVGPLDLRELDTSSVNFMDTMFFNAQIDKLDLSNFNINNVTDIHNMFEGFKGTEIVFGDNFNTSNVTDMTAMFNSSSITNLDLSSFDTSKAEDTLYDMFYDSAVTTVYTKNQEENNRFENHHNGYSILFIPKH